MLTLRFAIVLFSPLLLRPAILNEEPRGTQTYEIDTNVSRVFVKVGSGTVLGHPHGVEGRLKSGTLTFGRDGTLVFDTGSFTADTLESRKRAGLQPLTVPASDAKKVTETMRGSSVLDVSRFPTAEFHMTSLTPLDRQALGAPGTYRLEGEFTLHGVRRKLQFPARLEPSQQQRQMRLTGSFSFKQSDYGIKPYSTFGGVVSVTDWLTIMGDLTLTSPPPANGH
jgi:polyisoprenoid-binding protein YceI